MTKGTYSMVASEITKLIKEYLETPRADILSKKFDADRWGLIDIFRVADRRLEIKSLEQLAAKSLSTPARKILNERIHFTYNKTPSGNSVRGRR
jgi:hypothetical protein